MNMDNETTASSPIEAENLTPMNTTLASDRRGIQTVEFKDHNRDWVSAIPTTIDKTRQVAATPEVPLQEFFARPRQIWKHKWTGSNSTTQKALVINPWVEYLSSPRVQAKLKSFAQMRCSLKVKIAINGNGFLYGCKAVYYHPMTWRDVDAGYSPLGMTDGDVTINFRTKDFVRHSQKLHGFLIPSESLGCTFELPFLWHKNWLNVTNGEISYMGNLIFVTLNNLKTMSSGTAPEIDYTVFAWCENMELSLATDRDVVVGNTGVIMPWPARPLAAYPPEASNVAVSHAGYEDEYGKGPVSKMANSCALASHSLSKVPVIGPYASATASVFGALGSLASLFGFSRPAVIKDISPYKPMYLGNMANTDAGDTCQKLSLDSKQEVTVDPRVVGLDGIDEMTIASIAGRESFFRSITWQTGFQQAERIGIIAVNPMTCRMPNNPDHLHTRKIDMSGCAYASLPFGAWRGTMRYRFQIIACQFHRGRLALVWDPRSITEEIIDSKNSKEVDVHNYFKVVDLADCRDFTIDVGWGQATSFLPTIIRPGSGTWDERNIFVGNGDSTTLINLNNSNGMLGIYVLNPLVSTVNDGTVGQNIEINVYTSCPDLEVANPICNVMNRYTFVEPLFTNKPVPDPPDEGDISPVAVSHAGFEENSEQDHAPAKAPVHWQIGPKLETHDAETQYVFYGDPIVSLRALMKRYTFYVAYPITNKGVSDDAETVINKYTLPDYPIPPGRVGYNDYPPSIATTDNAGAKDKMFGWCYAQHSFLSFYSPAFLCRRGAIRWKYYTQRSSQLPNNETIRTKGCPPLLSITRGAFPANGFVPKLVAADGNDDTGYTTMREFHVNLPDGIGGQCVTSTDNQPVLEVEFPFYNYYRFAPTKEFAVSTVTTANTTILTNDSPHHALLASITGAKGVGTTLLSYVAAGDDYSLSMYMGPPLMFYVDYMDDIKPVNVLPFAKIQDVE